MDLNLLILLRCRGTPVRFKPLCCRVIDLHRKALAKPLFPSSSGTGTGSNSADMKDDKTKKTTKTKKLKSEVAAAQMRDSLVSEIVGNTRVAHDPFLSLDRSNGDKNGTKILRRNCHYSTIIWSLNGLLLLVAEVQN